MAKIYFCDACKKKMDWPASRGRKKETRCNVCNEPALCHSGDTALMSSKPSAGVNRPKPDQAAASVEKERPSTLRKPIPENVKKEKVLQIVDEGGDEAVAPIQKKKPQAELNADAFRQARERANSTTANVVLTEILEEAYEHATEGQYTHELSPECIDTITEKVLAELNSRGFEVQHDDNKIILSW